MTIEDLKNYFSQNFLNKNKIKGISIKKALKKHKNFFNELFKKFPELNQKNLKLKHIYLLFFKNYDINSLLCSVENCKNLARITSDGNLRKTCEEHKNISKEILKNNSKKSIQTIKLEYKFLLLKFKTLQKKINKKNILEIINQKINIFNYLKNEFQKFNSSKNIFYLVIENKEFFNTLFVNFPWLAQEDLRYLHLKNFFEKKDIICEVDECYKLKEIKHGHIKSVCKYHHNLNEEFRKEKIKKKLIDKYNGIGLQSSEIKNKYKKTMKLKYNQIHPMHIPEIRKKFLSPNNNSQHHLKNLDKLNKEFIEKNFLNENREFKYQEFKNFYGYSFSRPHQILKELNIDYKKRLGTSSYEDEIIDYIKSLFK